MSELHEVLDTIKEDYTAADLRAAEETIILMYHGGSITSDEYDFAYDRLLIADNELEERKK